MSLNIQGVTDEQTTCDLCGKTELGRTCIVVEDGTEVGRYGTSCVSRVLGYKVTAKSADMIEFNRRHNLHSAKVDFVNGMRALDGHRAALAREDIARFWIKGPEALAVLMEGLEAHAKSTN